jgi:protoporphyrinogen/coproporphyrinogen III oxidase
LRDGRIRKLPGNPFEILTTKSVSFSGKLRFLREIFYVPKKKSRDESVYEFFERHFGSEVADYFADPFVTGIYAGDAKKLSIKDAFPSMHEAEKKSSSLIRHLIQKRKSSRASPKTFQLEGGLETLFKNCDRILGKGRVHLSEPVTNIKRSSSGYNVQTEKKTYYAENVYLSSPAYIAAEILRASFPDLSKALNKIEYAPVISAHVKISKIEKMQFNGYGILIPSSEKRNILGVLWNSSTFPTQFQDKEHHYMTVFVGGVLNRAMMDLSEAKLKESIADELINLFNLKSKPELLHIRRHERAIPQFNLGYGEILKSIHLELEKYSGLQLAGNYMGGLSIAKTVTQAMNLVG